MRRFPLHPGSRRKAFLSFALGVLFFGLFLVLTDESKKQRLPAKHELGRIESGPGEPSADGPRDDPRTGLPSFAQIGPANPENVTPDDIEDMWKRRQEAATRYWEARRGRPRRVKTANPSGLPVARERIPPELDSPDPILGQLVAVEAGADFEGKSVEEFLKHRYRRNPGPKRKQ